MSTVLKRRKLRKRGRESPIFFLKNVNLFLNGLFLLLHLTGNLRFFRLTAKKGFITLTTVPFLSAFKGIGNFIIFLLLRALKNVLSCQKILYNKY